jgi:hypothetical protein
MRIRLACLLVFSCFTVTCFSQIKVKGIVRDTLGGYIPYATITVINNADQAVLYYGSSNKSGAFEIEIPQIVAHPDSLSLQATSVGYKKLIKPFVKGTMFYDLVLKEESKNLAPVVIKGERAKVKLNGDTVSYNAKAFSSPNDRVIEDVIKKLPGIQVDDKGKITYNGTAITNFYIDGDNLFDDKYVIGTRNIPNNIVDKIQVFENHQPIKVLAKKTVTGQVDMNITLKDTAHVKPINHAEIGAGLPGNYDGTLNSLIFFKKYKAINYFKTNNTGTDLADEVTSFNLEDFLSQLDIPKPNNLLSLGTVGAPDLPKYRYLLNHTGMINTNNLFTLHNDVQLKTNIYYLYDHQLQDYNSQTTFLLHDGAVRYTENQRADIYPDQLHAQINLNINKENYYLNNILITDYNKQDGNSLLNTNGAVIQQKLTDHLHNLSNEFNYIGNGKNNHAIEIYSFIKVIAEPQNLTITPGISADYFNDGISFSELDQSATIPSVFTNTYLSFHLATPKFKQSYRIGFNSQNEHLQTSLSKIQADGSPAVQLDSGINDLHWVRNKIYLLTQYEWEMDKLKLTLSLPLAYQYIAYSDKGFQLNQNRNDFIFNPEMHLKFETSVENYFVADYKYNSNFGGVEDIYRGYILKDYRTLDFNLAPVSTVISQTAHLGFVYRKSVNVLFANLNIAYTFKNQNNITATNINNNFQLQYNLPFPNTLNILKIYGGISKYLFFINTTVSLNALWTKSEVNQIQNGQLLPFDNYSTNITGKANSKISDWFYFNYLITYSHFQSAQRGDQTIEISESRINQLQQKATLEFSFPKAVSFNVVGEQLFSQQSFYKNSDVFFMDLTAKYRFKKYHTDLECGIQNIANVKQYNITTVNANSTVINQYTIRGRTGLIKASFNF